MSGSPIHQERFAQKTERCDLKVITRYTSAELVLERSTKGGMTLTFKAFLAASASDRLSKLTNPTGWGDKKTEQKEETWFKAEY